MNRLKIIIKAGDVARLLDEVDDLYEPGMKLMGTFEKFARNDKLKGEIEDFRREWREVQEALKQVRS